VALSVMVPWPVPPMATLLAPRDTAVTDTLDVGEVEDVDPPHCAMLRRETTIATRVRSGEVCPMEYFMADGASTSMPPALLLNTAANPALPRSRCAGSP
jgi:hypothetical protein